MDFAYASTVDGTDPRSRVGSTLLGKWRLDALLGVGGMGAVYSATHRNGARSAVKILHRSCSEDAVARHRFRREGYIANKLAQAGAVRVLDDDVAPDGSAFLVMDLLEGRALNDIVEDVGGRLDAASVLCLADRVLTVLAAAHELGIVHRDIKPENVFVTNAGVVKLLDFGIASTAELSRTLGRATKTGTPLGTPAYMSPEQARGQWNEVGPASDIWATGAMMFSMLSGEIVHPEGSVAEILAALVTRRARSVAKACRGLPRSVVAIVDRALASKPAQRWPSAVAMRSAVRAAYRAVCGQPMPLGALSRMPTAPRDDLPWHRRPRAGKTALSTSRSSSRAHVLDPTLESARAPTPRSLRGLPRTAWTGLVSAALIAATFVGTRAASLGAASGHEPQALAAVDRSESASRPRLDLPMNSPSPNDTEPTAEPAPLPLAHVASPLASPTRIAGQPAAISGSWRVALPEPAPVPTVAPSGMPPKPERGAASMFDRRR
jgi:serine/threonine protein kinase